MPQSQPQGDLFNEGWLGPWIWNHCTHILCFSAGNKIPLHPATGVRQLWVSTLSHWLGRPPFVSGARQEPYTLPVSRVPWALSKSEVSLRPASRREPCTPTHRTLLPFPQDSPLSLALTPCCKKALQHSSFFGHTVTPLSQLPLGSQCPAPCVSVGLPSTQLASSSLTSEPWFIAPLASKHFLQTKMLLENPKYQTAKPELHWPNHAS